MHAKICKIEILQIIFMAYIMTITAKYILTYYTSIYYTYIPVTIPYLYTSLKLFKLTYPDVWPSFEQNSEFVDLFI